MVCLPCRINAGVWNPFRTALGRSGSWHFSDWRSPCNAKYHRDALAKLRLAKKFRRQDRGTAFAPSALFPKASPEEPDKSDSTVTHSPFAEASVDIPQALEVWPYVMPMLITGMALFALLRLADHSVDPIRAPTDQEHVWPLGG
jgi:hypothetical protein